MPPPPPPPPRPLVAAGLALALGSLAGAELGPAGAGVVALVALGAATVVVLSPGLAERPGVRAAGGRGVVALSLLLGAVAAARGAAAGARLPPRRPAEELARAAVAPAGPVVGRWRARGTRWGWIDARPCAVAPPLLLEPEAPPPPEGALVALLPADLAVPWPRGPVPGPFAREGRFAGVLPVRPDALVVLAPPERERTLLARAGAPLARVVAALRDRVRARLAARAPDGPDGATLAGLERALVLGERDGVDAELADLFTRTGLRHLLSISGMHVGIVAALLVLPATRAGRRLLPRRLAAASVLAGVLALVLFVPLAGGEPPVERAAVAVVLALLADRLPPRGRRPDGLSLWSLALVLECLGDPVAAARVGVQLSYVATLGLLVGSRRFLPRARPVPALAARSARPLGARLARGARLALSASAAASLATLPIVWATFGEASPWGALLTPLAVPPLAGALAAAFARLLAPHPALLPGALLDLPARALLLLAAWGDALPGTPVPLPERPAALLAAAAAALLLALAGARGARRPALVLAGALLLPWAPAPARLEVHALAVGHGTCVVARAPGIPALVFDAGSRDRPFVLGEALEPLLARWDPGAAVVVLSHPDRDHAGALPRLVSRRPPRLWLGALTAEARAALPRGTPALDLAAGRLELGPGLLADGPVRGALLRGRPGRTNEASRALELRLGGEALLLTGDAEAEGLAAMLAAGLLPGPLRLLLLPHHGSDTPLLGPLLARTRPAEVWVSEGGPPPVAAELDRRGLAWRTTLGPLSLRLPGPAPAPPQPPPARLSKEKRSGGNLPSPPR